MDIGYLLDLMVKKLASDLHVRVFSPPVLRIDGELIVQEDLPVSSIKEVESAFEHVTTPEQREVFYKTKELDFAYSIPGLARFRVSVLRQRGTISLAFRSVPFKIFTIDQLQLPQLCKQLVQKPRGLILVTGPTGSGKSTTMAAMIDHLNDTMRRNVITIEDPIEYLHSNKKCLIAQRDLGDDTNSFDIALIHALRHDPDVIVVGEMRDLPTVTTALRAAETGHLVLATLHTVDASQTVDRVIDMYPSDQQPQIRLQFSQVLVAIISQALLPRLQTKGRIGAFEILLANPAVRNLIREGKTFELASIMQLNSALGMQTLDNCLAEFVKHKLVSREEALLRSSHPDRLEKMI
ncbi:MAG: type IV pilus twitching motility protein PilT [Dehalococcoidales bacterium]|nr:type IV pilus twitching motility protein PilT [Dehalococcoidales bacterium]